MTSHTTEIGSTVMMRVSSPASRIAIASLLAAAGAAASYGCGSNKDAASGGDGGAGTGTGTGGGAGGTGTIGDSGETTMQPFDSGTTSGGACVHAAYPSPDIYDRNCMFSRDAYVQIANAYTSPAGLSYRFGPDSTYYHPTPQTLPTQPQAQVKLCGNTDIPGPPTQLLLYQLGNDCMIHDPGNYSSDEGIVLYDSDVKPVFDAGVPGAGGGVDNIQIEVYGYNVFLFMPSPATDFGTIPYAGQLTIPSWTTLAGGAVHSPITTARGIAPSFGQTSQVGFTAFNDGIIGTIGTNTEQGDTVVKLPDGLVPTAMAVTNGSEFLLATIWDTTTISGKLAVYSIESDHKGDGDFDDGIYDFHQHLPGFPSTGDATTMKLLGTIDLPGMVAPTDIAVASNYQSDFFRDNSGNYSQPAKIDLTQQATWTTFTGKGVNSTQRSTGGFAVITSRSERKAIFVDLQPLFDFFNATYFTDFATFQKTQSNWGPAPAQWPYTFDQQASEIPKIVATIALDQIPTAVYAGRSGNADPTKGIGGLIATMDGALHIYDVGGLADSTAAGTVTEIGSVMVGNNPTNLTIRKAGTSSTKTPDPVSGATNDVEGTQVIVTSRGDRAINFVTIAGSAGTLYKTLQDSRMIDPVQADDADHESFSSFILDIADLEGRQVLSYRYGPITLPMDMVVYPLPKGADGKDAFEFGGSYGVQGTPFQVSGTNVP